MGAIFLFLVAALVFATGTAMADETDSVDGPAPAEMTADEVAERVQRFYRDTEDFQAAFLQTYTDVAAGEARRSRGRVYFKKPGMMRWDYYSADDANQRERVWVSDGNIFWIYEFELQQVFQECLESTQLPTALRFLMGQGDLLEEFDVEFADESTAQQPQLRLIPKEPTGHYREVRFVVDPETFQVSTTTILDPYGNTNEIDFRNSRVNRNLPDSGFQFEPPEGARLLNPNHRCD